MDFPSYPSDFHYRERLLPWGSTGREVEVRLKAMGLREAWRQLARSYRVSGGQSIHDAHYNAMVAFKEKLESGEEELTSDDTVFIEKAREGLMLDLPKRAGIEKELDWISANVERNFPNVQDAPSLGCINLIIALRRDKDVLGRWWQTTWSKRLSPGDVKTRKGIAVKEDVVDDSEADEAELRRRLFGGG